MCLLGVKSPPKKNNYWAWIGVFNPKWRNVSCYRNYCIYFNQVLHNDRDHQIVVVVGPNTPPTNPRWRTAAIKKYPLNRHISATVWPILMKFGMSRILAPYSGPCVKISNFWKSKTAAAAILKITKIAISLQWLDRSLRNLVRRCQMSLLTAPAVKRVWILKIQQGGRPPFWNPLNRHSTDFDEIGHGDGYWSPAPNEKLNFQFSTILYGGQTAAIWRIEKLLYFAITQWYIRQFDNKQKI